MKGYEHKTFYISLPSPLGNFAIVWQKAENRIKILRIFLPHKSAFIEDTINTAFQNAINLPFPKVTKIGQDIQKFLQGDAIVFKQDILNTLAFEKCSNFQRKILLYTYKIKRGTVINYGYIAKKLGMPKASRAVGSVMAHNPFPIIIPCHRVIKADGKLGGYQTGTNIKRLLLELEGIKFSHSGKVITKKPTLN